MALDMCTNLFGHGRCAVCPELLPTSSARISKSKPGHRQTPKKVKFWSSRRIPRVSLQTKSQIDFCRLKCRGLHLDAGMTSFTDASRSGMVICNSEVVVTQ